MKIEKQIRKESSRKTRIILTSLAIMILMTYIVLSLNEEELFTGWEIYFAYGYLALVNLLLIINILRISFGNMIQFSIADGKLKIKEGIFKSHFSINLDRIIYVGISEKKGGDFEILIVLDKGKRSRKLAVFGTSLVESKPQYRDIYNHLLEIYPDKKFYCYILGRDGAYKYYYLYSLYKNSYKAEFSKAALEYIKRFVEEYNLQ